MTVNIQFCGGCNPRYDRGAFARRIREAFPDFEYSYNERKHTDAALILCGCSAACAVVPEESAHSVKLVVNSADMWEEAVAFLQCVSGKKS